MGILRLLLAITVVLGHNQMASTAFGPGVIIAVKAFFVISGFYMSLILSTKYADAPVHVFFLNRFLRLWPTYAFVLVLTIFACVVAPSGRLNAMVDLNYWKSLLHLANLEWLKLALVFSNLTMLGIENTIYVCLDASTGALHLFNPVLDVCKEGLFLNHLIFVPQAWTISIEIAFYLLAPWLVRTSTSSLIGILAVGIVARIGLAFAGWNVNPWSRSTIPFEFVFFVAGVAAHRIYQSIEWKPLQPLLPWIIGGSLLIATALFGQYAYVYVETTMWSVYIIGFTLGLPFLFQVTKDNRFDRWIGELSYPVYISHVLIIAVLDAYGGAALFNSVGYGGWLLINVIAVVAFSALCVVFISEPTDRFRARWLAASRAERMVLAAAA